MAKSKKESEKSPTGELFATLKSYFNQLSEGEKTPTEVASAFNQLARDGADSVKARIAEEVESSVSKMGFIKRDEYDLLLARIESLENSLKKSVNENSIGKLRPKKVSPSKVKDQKAPIQKAPIQKVAAKKAAVKKASK